MSDLILTCEGCGKRFVWTEKEQLESAENSEGEGGLLEPEPHCKLCRPKQDQQRA